MAKNAKTKAVVKRVINVAAVAAGATLIAAPAMAAGDFDVSALTLTGLTAAAAAVGTLKAGPNLAIWGWNKVVSMIGR